MWRFGYLLGFDPGEVSKTRAIVARMFLHGTGIEVGALHNPLPVPEGVAVRYVDRLPTEELRKHYPEFAEGKLVHVDIVDDGEVLATVADGSLDFVIANQVFEHFRNPLGAVANFMRVLKPGGILYLAVPDKRYGCDQDRPVTPIEHLLSDYQGKPFRDPRLDYEEWTRMVCKIADPGAARELTAKLMATNYSIHFHAWTQTEVFEILVALRRQVGLKFNIELLYRMGGELLLIARKTDT
jgi:SAM-dependent methyltransferase